MNKTTDITPKITALEVAVNAHLANDEAKNNYYSSRELVELLYNLTGETFDESELIKLLRKNGVEPMVADTFVHWSVIVKA